MDAQSLQDAVCIVTGGGSGIGRAIATSLIEAGADVTIVGRNEDRLQAAASGIGGDIHVAAGDVTDEPQVQQIFSDVSDRCGGRLDVLVNSAGAFDGGRIDTVDAEAWQNTIDVNVTGPFLCSREAFRAMVKHGNGGRIINVGSISGKRARHHSAPYTTSKHALWGLTQALALDGREFGIAASCLNPGNTAVERRASGHAVAGRDEGAETMMDAETVANVAVLMASVPPHVNLLEATVLPIDQDYLGRG